MLKPLCSSQPVTLALSLRITIPTTTPLPQQGHRTLTLVSPGIIEVVQDGHQDVQYITALQDVKQELLQGGDQEGVRTELPEENKQLLVEVDLLGGVWERVVEEASEATQHEGEVFLAVDATQVVDEEVAGHGGLRGSGKHWKQE
ncbi:hypothetical protein E2C01_061908 [Portunus trituberculatus]|uniref:Uncharacterized protein n=1 Tax=Portunus trituberculatus TaxID=210409 RepID=A0A5B7HDN9_PORTR|nr:hypothetical protein [Portunus trituberculatus]